MWTYKQVTGQISSDAGPVGVGYSGSGDGKNNPVMQYVKDVGPIPQGHYTIGPPHDTETHGPYVLGLDPSAENEMHGRAGFLIHGDSINAPGTASKGCIILARAIRQKIWESGDHQLLVVSSVALDLGPAKPAQ